MATGQRDEFERRLLALVRNQLDWLDESKEHGYEIGDFVLTFKFFEAPAPDSDLDPWAGGPYPGWWPNSLTVGSSPAYWIDEQLLVDALEYTREQKRRELEEEEEDEEDEVES